MLKIPNRWLQWLQNIQKPLAGLFRHPIWPKNEEDRLPGSSPSNLLSLDHQISPMWVQPSLCAHFRTKTYHWVHNQKTMQTVGRLGNLAPNRQTIGHMGHMTTPPHIKGLSFKTKY